MPTITPSPVLTGLRAIRPQYLCNWRFHLRQASVDLTLRSLRRRRDGLEAGEGAGEEGLRYLSLMNVPNIPRVVCFFPSTSVSKTEQTT